MRARAEANTPADVLSTYGDGSWPLKTVYDMDELASNGNYLEPEDIAVRHGICGDPEQVRARMATGLFHGGIKYFSPGCVTLDRHFMSPRLVAWGPCEFATFASM